MLRNACCSGPSYQVNVSVVRKDCRKFNTLMRRPSATWAELLSKGKKKKRFYNCSDIEKKITTRYKLRALTISPRTTWPDLSINK